jgi:hypothetical protein
MFTILNRDKILEAEELTDRQPATKFDSQEIKANPQLYGVQIP